MAKRLATFVSPGQSARVEVSAGNKPVWWQENIPFVHVVTTRGEFSLLLCYVITYLLILHYFYDRGWCFHYYNYCKNIV